MCASKKFILCATIACVALLLFSTGINIYMLNILTEKQIEKCSGAINASELKVLLQNENKIILVQNNNNVKNLLDTQVMVIKNELLKILMEIDRCKNKVMNFMKIQNEKNSEDLSNQITNLLEIVERIYDFTAANENSRTLDNYNYYNLVKNQVIQYFDSKINKITNQTCGNM